MFRAHHGVPQVNGELKAHAPFERGDALLFVSHKPHCVAPVTSGLRQVLVMELWVRAVG